jgi:hypothetical protein
LIFIIGLILFAGFQYARGADMQGIENFGKSFIKRFGFGSVCLF